MLATSVKNLLQQHGYSMTLKREASGASYDPATGGFTGGSVATETVTGVFINYTDDEVDGSRITVTDRKLLMQASGVNMAPKTDDLIDDEVRIVSVRTLKDADGVMAYICQVRG